MKKKFLLGLILGLFVVVIPTIFAVTSYTVEMQSPKSGSIASGNYIFNTTFGEINESGNQTCEFWVYATDTANSSYVMIANISNTTANITYGVNVTWDTTNFEDSSNAYTYVVCHNLTTTTATSSAVQFTIDNTAPTITASSPSDETTDTDGDVTFTITVPPRNTTSANLIFSRNHPGSFAYAMTNTTTGFTVSLSNIPEQRYEWYVTTTDGLNSTTISITDLIIQGPSTSSRRVGAVTALAQTTEGSEMLTSRTFSFASETRNVFTNIGTKLKNNMFGPFSYAVWLIFVVIATISFFVWKSNKK